MNANLLPALIIRHDQKSVSNANTCLLSSLRASGYLLFPMFLLTAAVGGNYSDWTESIASVGVRVILYTIAPIAILVGLWSRVRYVFHLYFKQIHMGS